MRATFVGLLLAVLVATTSPLYAQGAEAWRGGWIADVGGARYVLYLVLHEGALSGTWCFDCSNPDHLAFVDDGSIDAAGLHFNLYFSASDGSYSVVPVDAQLDDAKLQLTLKRTESETSTLVMRRAPRPASAPVAAANPSAPAPVRTRELPGLPETLTPDLVAGLWLSGAGPTKQYFIFKRHKDGVRGLVCGPCASPEAFAPLENIRLDGNRFHFDIVHEDNGIGFEEHGPFRNVTEAQVARNEMQMSTVASFDPNGRKYEMTLLGPVRYMQAVQP